MVAKKEESGADPDLENGADEQTQEPAAAEDGVADISGVREAVAVAAGNAAFRPRESIILVIEIAAADEGVELEVMESFRVHEACGEKPAAMYTSYERQLPGTLFPSSYTSYARQLSGGKSFHTSPSLQLTEGDAVRVPFSRRLPEGKPALSETYRRFSGLKEEELLQLAEEDPPAVIRNFESYGHAAWAHGVLSKAVERDPVSAVEFSDSYKNVSHAAPLLRKAVELLLQKNPRELLRLASGIAGETYAHSCLSLAASLDPAAAIEFSGTFEPDYRVQLLQHALNVAMTVDPKVIFERADIWLENVDDEFAHKVMVQAAKIHWAPFLLNVDKFGHKSFAASLVRHTAIMAHDLNTEFFLRFANRFLSFLDAQDVEQLMIIAAKRKPQLSLETFHLYAEMPFAQKMIEAILRKSFDMVVNFSAREADDVVAERILEIIAQKDPKALLQHAGRFSGRVFARQIISLAVNILKAEDAESVFVFASLYPDKDSAASSFVSLAEIEPKAALRHARHYSREPYASDVRMAAVKSNPVAALELSGECEPRYRKEVIRAAAQLALESEPRALFALADKYLYEIEPDFAEEILRKAQERDPEAALIHAEKYVRMPFAQELLATACSRLLEHKPEALLQFADCYMDHVSRNVAEFFIMEAAKRNPVAALENFENYSDQSYANDVMSMVVRHDVLRAFAHAVQSAHDVVAKAILEVVAFEAPKIVLVSHELYGKKPFGKDILMLAAETASEKNVRGVVECFGVYRGEPYAEKILMKAIDTDPIPVLCLFEQYVREPYGMHVKELAAEASAEKYPDDALRVADVYAADPFGGKIIAALAERQPALALRCAAHFCQHEYALPILEKAAGADPGTAFDCAQEFGPLREQVLRTALKKISDSSGE